jgi:diguanylate cyclase (GGDEF)-like protein/PAS domain S-box-containing protein
MSDYSTEDEHLDISQELQIIADLIRDPNPEVRRRAVDDNLAKVAFRLIQTRDGSEQLARRLESDPEKLRNELAAEKDKQIGEYMDVANAGTWEWNVVTGEETFDENCAAMAGYAHEELGRFTSEAWDNLTHPDDLERSREQLQMCIDGVTDYYVCELRTKHKDGHWIWLEDRGKVVERDVDGKALRIIGLSMDITEHKQDKEKIERLSLHDDLTGLGNRRYLGQELDIIERSGGRKHPVSMISIDVKDFKDINDTFGHPAGDKVLRTVAVALTEVVRPYDHVIRMGGDEFLIVLPNSDAEVAQEIKIRIEKKLEELHPHYPVILSIGAATTTEVSNNLEDLITLADKKMYEHKHTQEANELQSGRNKK